AEAADPDLSDLRILQESKRQIALRPIDFLKICFRLVVDRILVLLPVFGRHAGESGLRGIAVGAARLDGELLRRVDQQPVVPAEASLDAPPLSGLDVSIRGDQRQDPLEDLARLPTIDLEDLHAGAYRRIAR